MGSTPEGGSRPAADADMDADRVHREAVSDGERDFEKQDSRPEYQDAFGDEEYAEVKYKTLSWCAVMVAETVSLGILSLPAVVAALGLVPAIILLVALGLMSTYTGYTIGQFKWRYPFIHSMGDAGEVILGSFGRELFGTGQLLLVIFIMASHILTFTVAMNSITDHGTCSIVFGVVGLVISFVLCLPRTLAKVSFLSVASFISVLSAVLIVMIAVGVQRPWHGGVNATVDTSLYKAFLAVSSSSPSHSWSVTDKTAGHVAFFGFMAELKNPRDYPKSLFLLQGIDTCLYIVAAVVIYCYAGDDVTSPALGSASETVKKVAYGIALPTIIIGGVVNGHVACKYIYVRMWRHSDRMHKRDLVATGSWVLIGLATWIVAWIIAEAIPVFNNLLSLVASLFASWFTYSWLTIADGFSALFWLYLNKGRFFSTPMKTALTILNVFIMGIACCICGLGLYVSGKALHDDPGSASFSCANNA
ncbi:N amino acid transport system protein [Aspergillus udagawae]|uniref:N amino acid transport system protein n=1 Tax=Aspergillus udagawae TaxID=91492 RepID=A0A8H3S661_9EURO|nr:N amino acid transport system protein [Aspergillus udagawae]